MSPTRVLIAAGLVGQVCLVPLASASWPSDPFLSLPVCRAAGQQYVGDACSDGTGGILVAWIDYRSGNADIYAQRVTASGEIAPGWPADGRAIAVAADVQDDVHMLADGAGGAYLAWSDRRSGNADIYAIRVTGSGAVAAGWPANGLAVSPLPDEEYGPRLCSDGAGGAYLAWQRVYSFSDHDVRLTRLLPGGGAGAGYPVYVDVSGLMQTAAEIAPDGAGGALVAYEDNIPGDYDIHFKRFGSAGALLANWTNGHVGDQRAPRVLPDGSGGALIGYTDQYPAATNVVVARISGPGIFVTSTTVLTDGANDYSLRGMATDGSGGAYVLGRTPLFLGYVRMFVGRVQPVGGIPSGWTAPGVDIGIGSDSYSYPFLADEHGGVFYVYNPSPSVERIGRFGTAMLGWPALPSGLPATTAAMGAGTAVPDGEGGAVAVWSDQRDGVSSDIWAERIDRFGTYGDAAPRLSGVRDVPNDQGGRVRVSWSPSYLDADPRFGVSSYRVWRQVPATVVRAALARGAARMLGADAPGDAGAPVLRKTSLGAATYWWEPIATTPAAALPGYSVVVDTESDSLATGNPRTLFMVEAVGTVLGFWDSAPDSGYSVDNLAPAPPTPFTGTFAPTFTRLSWGRNTESDFARYRLYRGATPSFVPGWATFVAEQADTGYVAPAGNWYWKLTAVDAHGNESPASLVSPAGTVGVGDAPAVLAFERTSTNPTPRGAAFRLSLPRAARASVRVYDAAGRHVRDVASGELDAGAHDLSWDGADASGTAAPPGLYFVRATTAGFERTVRVVKL